jgi:precorrin-3B synthase
MSAALRSPPASVVPMPRGLCPGLSRPLPTGDGLLVRFRPAGTIALKAFATLCAAARAHGNGIIEVTARGSIQVRGLTTHSAPRFAEVIAASGIAADIGVPIVCNPLAGLDPAEIFDGLGFAAALRYALTQHPLAARLHPKVSIVVDSGGSLDISRLSGDIRMRAERFDRATMLRLAVGGDDANAFELGLIAAPDGVEVVSRLLLVLAERGLRARDIVAAEGMACFADAIAFARPAVAERDLDVSNTETAIGLHALRDGSFAGGIELAFGHAEAAALEKLVDAAAMAGGRGLRTAPRRSLLAIGLTREDAAHFFAAAAQLGFVTQAEDPRRHVIACAGAPLCASAHIGARTLAPSVAAATAPYLNDGLTLHISGCAKGCAHPGAAALTVVGTPGGCDLVANGSARDAAFAAASVHELSATVAAYLRERRPPAEGTSHV